MSKIKVYTRAEIDHIHANIPYREKKKLAAHLGIKPSALSRYINARDHGYRMPEALYNKIIDYINSNTSSNGNVPTETLQATESEKEPHGMGLPAAARIQHKRDTAYAPDH